MSYHDEIDDATHMNCDKCGLPVPIQNNMTLVEAATGLPGCEWAPTLWYARHFLPVLDDDGEVICPGSPSRAQYVEGQPRDTRGYEYDVRLEAIYRRAFATVQGSSETI